MGRNRPIRASAQPPKQHSAAPDPPSDAAHAPPFRPSSPATALGFPSRPSTVTRSSRPNKTAQTREQNPSAVLSHARRSPSHSAAAAPVQVAGPPRRRAASPRRRRPRGAAAPASSPAELAAPCLPDPAPARSGEGDPGSVVSSSSGDLSPTGDLDPRAATVTGRSRSGSTRRLTFSSRNPNFLAFSSHHNSSSVAPF